MSALYNQLVLAMAALYSAAIAAQYCYRCSYGYIGIGTYVWYRGWEYCYFCGVHPILELR